MARSYYEQSRSHLEEALAAARKAAEQSPRFGFAQTRVAEMEFSSGRIERARAAVDLGLKVSPRNAEALALRGFLLSAQNKIPEAITYFNQAIAIDGALGNAWLGRGLCLIRQGHAEAGRQDLQVAATVEPNRAVLRSYVGKAFSNAGQNGPALKELELARTLDARDPTAWLYSALIKQQENRINEGVRDLEESQELNQNRSVYRSRLLLDQDRAVRGANLATVYADAGMSDVSLREAVRAVNSDYANFSAHLFLANSYSELQNNNRINLRYETPAVDEYLVANILADARAGTLSPYVTQQEYSKLFERDRFGFSSETEYLSRGDWSQTAAQYGIFGNSSYVAEVSYHSFNGQRPNGDLEDLTTSLKVKQHLTPQDSIYFEALLYDADFGDGRFNEWRRSRGDEGAGCFREREHIAARARGDTKATGDSHGVGAGLCCGHVDLGNRDTCVCRDLGEIRIEQRNVWPQVGRANHTDAQRNRIPLVRDEGPIIDLAGDGNRPEVILTIGDRTLRVRDAVRERECKDDEWQQPAAHQRSQHTSGTLAAKPAGSAPDR
jgi:tetratricopeptide (TPR) repeat protein